MRLRPAAVLLLAALVAAACGGGRPAAGCDRWGAPGGSDRAPGTGDAPLRTPQAVLDGLRPGQTGCLRSGTYAGDPYVLVVRRSGRPGRPVTLRSAPGERATLRGVVWVTRRAAHVVLSRLAIRGSGAQNAVKVYGRDITLADSDLTNGRRRRSCLMLGSRSAGRAVRVRVLRNRLHDCGSPAGGNGHHAIYASVVRGGLVEGNLITRPAAYAVQLYPDARDVVVRGNVLRARGSARGGIVVGGDGRSASTSNLVEGNVVSGARPWAVGVAWERRVGRDNVARGNCVTGPAVRSAAGLRAVGNVGGLPGAVKPGAPRHTSGTAACARALARWASARPRG